MHSVAASVVTQTQSQTLLCLTVSKTVSSETHHLHWGATEVRGKADVPQNSEPSRQNKTTVTLTFVRVRYLP